MTCYSGPDPALANLKMLADRWQNELKNTGVHNIIIKVGMYYFNVWRPAGVEVVVPSYISKLARINYFDS